MLQGQPTNPSCTCTNIQPLFQSPRSPVPAPPPPPAALSQTGFPATLPKIAYRLPSSSIMNVTPSPPLLYDLQITSS